MALSQREQRALEQIAADLIADDPRLASTLLHGWQTKRRRRRMVAAVIFMAGMAMQACAILIPRSVAGATLAVSVLGYLVMFGAVLLWCRRSPLRLRRFRFRGDSQ